MPEAVHNTGEVMDLLTLEQAGSHRFIGKPQAGRRHVFGGHLVGQSLMSAVRTVEDRRPHALHCIFIASAAPEPVEFEVEVLRDGGAFSIRRVVASQHGRCVFQMMASFQREEEGLTHQAPMPVAVADPTSLIAWGPQWKARAERENRPFHPAPIEIYTEQADPYDNRSGEPHRQIWMRAPDPLPDDPASHEALFAYASDYCLLFTALQPHGIARFDTRLQNASLDHSIWFHRPFRMDDWLMLAMDSPSAGGGRGLSFSSVYDRAGRRVATVAQEALIRLRACAPSGA
jgi:acyl-CoA thioesterase-2